MLNNAKDTWKFRNDPGWEFPEPGRTVIMLVEHDVIYEENEEIPFLEFGTVIKEILPNGEPFYSWKLVEYDPDTQEEILQQYFTVVAWRYF